MALHKEKDGQYNALKGKDGLGYLKQQISEHLDKEAKLYLLILSADFTDEENEELVGFLQEHPLSKFMGEVRQWQRNQVRKKQPRP